MQNFNVTPAELVSNKTWRILEGYVDVRLGPATFESELKGRQRSKWLFEGRCFDSGTGIAQIEIGEVRHLRVNTLSEEVLLRLGYRDWSSLTDERNLRLNSEITIIFYWRNH